MKHLLFGDIHGKSLEGIEKLIQKINPENIICLGDFDQVTPIHQLMDLEQRYKKIRFLTVPGNHDHAILNERELWSPELQKQGKNHEELHTELKNDKSAYSYIKRLVNETTKLGTWLVEKRFGRKDYKTIIIHGAYKGDWWAVPEDLFASYSREFWFRLGTEEDHRRNFQVMASKGYKIMIRGHDHKPNLASMKRGSIEIEDAPRYGKEYPLERNKRYTITVGAWCNGNYALITPGAEPKVIFKRLS